jgi:predicted ATP-dependent Lon-type protease
MDRVLFTDHFGQVSDVLAEAFAWLRDGMRAGVLMGRVHFGGALSGRDQNEVNKTVSGLLKLLYPDLSRFGRAAAMSAAKIGRLALREVDDAHRCRPAAPVRAVHSDLGFES